MQHVKILISALIMSVGLNSISHAASKREKTDDLAETKGQLALQFLLNDDLRNAVDTIEEAVRISTRPSSIWLARAQIYQEMNQPREVEYSFQKALSGVKYAGEASNNYGWYLCENKQVAKSIPLFDKALADKTYAAPYVALMNKGICQGRLGKHMEADSSLLEAQRISPDGFNFPTKELARNNLNAKNPALAEKYFQQFIDGASRLSPDDMLLGVQIGRLGGKYEWVSRYISQLRTEYPQSIEFKEVMSGSNNE